MLKNYNYIVQTALFFALAIGTKVQSEPKLSPYIFNSNTAECAEDGSYSKFDEFKDFLGGKFEDETIPAFEISCFKNWLDEEDDQNIILIIPQLPMYSSHEPLHKLRIEASSFFTREYRNSDEYQNETLPKQKEKIIFSSLEINKAGDIFPKSSDLHDRDVVSTSEFTSLIEKDRGLIRLIQSNLKRPIPQKSDFACANEVPSRAPFYNSQIDGQWGRGSKAALVIFAETCQKGDHIITGPMIAGMLLPQLFVLSDVEATPESVSVDPFPVYVDQTHSEDIANQDEDIANQDTESENLVTSPPEPIVAAEKDVEGTPVEDPYAGLELEKEISNLRDTLKENDVKISTLRETILNLRSSKDEALSGLKKEISKKTIFQIWEDLEIKVNGIMANGNRVYADTQRQDGFGCILSASEDVMKSAVEAYKNLSCYQHTFGDLEIDRSKSFSWDEGKREITVHLLPQREKYIKSMETAGIIDGLTENSWKTCGIELSLLRDTELVKLGEYTGLYSAWDDVGRQGAFLKDSGLESEKIAFEGISVLINTGKVEDQKCSLPSGIQMPISTGDYIPKGSPQALIDRNGHVTLYDLPISAVKGTTLAVFFDTNVGVRDSINYAFNESLTDKRVREIHKTYFSAFPQALKSYFRDQSKFENIIIFQSLSEEEARNAATYNSSNFRLIFESEGIDNKRLNNALDEFVSEFNPGQIGAFSDKQLEIQELLNASGPIEFLSFGPSGLDHSEVCNVGKRTHSSQAVTIFDVWTGTTLDELLRTEQLDSRRLQLVNNCANNEQIFGLKVSLGDDQDDISRSLLKYLNGYLGRQ